PRGPHGAERVPLRAVRGERASPLTGRPRQEVHPGVLTCLRVSSRPMRLTPVFVVIAIGGGALYGKLLHDRELQQGKIKAHEDEKQADKESQPPPPPSVETPPVKPRKGVDRVPVLSPEDAEKLSEARGQLYQGKFDAALEATRSVKGSADLELAAAQMGEKA